MDRIAFIMGETFIYWSGIIISLAAASSVCLFLGLYTGKSGKIMGGALTAPLAIFLSLYLARVIHWYCRADSYESLTSALTNLSSGGYALMGAFFGCALAAVIVHFLRVAENLPDMLDCMAVAGSGGIAVGRLACFFSTADRGQILAVQQLPWAYPVTNPVSGAVEYRLATFLIQAIVVGILFLALLVFYLMGSRQGRLRSGDTTLLFILVYGASQIVLDSTRYDSLFFRSNGFVSIVQVLSAAGMLLAAVVFSCRMVRTMGLKNWHIGLWAALAALFSVAGYMEYYVQRHSNRAVLAYTIMSLCLVAFSAVTVFIRYLSIHGPIPMPKPKPRPKKPYAPKTPPASPKNLISSSLPPLAPEIVDDALISEDAFTDFFTEDVEVPSKIELDINNDNDWDIILHQILKEE